MWVIHLKTTSAQTYFKLTQLYLFRVDFLDFTKKRDDFKIRNSTYTETNCNLLALPYLKTDSMKKLVIALCLLSTHVATAQWDDFQGLVFMKWGYQGGKTTISDYFYTTNPTPTTALPDGYTNLTAAPSSTGVRDFKFTNKAIFMEIEAIKKNLIFGMRFGLGLKKTVPGEQGFVVRETTGFNATFGYGFAIKNFLSIIPTVRYNWSRFYLDNSGTPTTSDNSMFFRELGGNQRGFGVNVMMPFGEHILLRGGYYYEWIFRASKQFKGLATTPEVELYIPLDDDHIFGFAFKVAMPSRKMYETFSLNNPNYYAPEVSYKSLIWEASFSIPLTGSTTRQIVTVTVVE
jgi:hypothetical protein